MSVVRTRFAPSPTGFLHMGGVRTALFNWLYARSHHGQFLLRIDDTDQQRHVEEAIGIILSGFRWIGMDWDEGPQVNGPHAPYYQSQRRDQGLYRTAADDLLARGVIYRDFTTTSELETQRSAAEKAKTAFRFRRPALSADQEQKYLAEGRPFALRFEVPPGRTLVLNDLIKGPVEQKTSDLGDFVIVRPDGMPLYNFASVVDDLEMEITHILRAEEHLSNTFPQLLLFEAVANGRPLPQIGHVPYVAASGSKKKMSKRDGGARFDDYIEAGYLPDAVLNYLSRLGWSLDGTQEIFTRAELIEKFTLERVNSSPASHDPDKLFWIQGEWMKTLPMDQKVAGVLPFLRSENLVTPESDPIAPETQAKIEAVIKALDDRLKIFSDILKLGRFFFTETPTYDPDAVKKRLKKPGVPDVLRDLDAIISVTDPYDHDTLEKAIHGFADQRTLKMGDVVNPLRVAVTGQGVGPGLYDCLVILGRDQVRARLAATIAMLESQA